MRIANKFSICYGSTRIVFIVGKYAIKIPSLRIDDHFMGMLYGILLGWQGNRFEYVWSKENINKSLNYPFNKTIISLFGSFIVVQRKASPISIEQFLEIEPVNFDGYEHKINSFGIVDEKIVILDYDGRSIKEQAK